MLRLSNPSLRMLSKSWPILVAALGVRSFFVGSEQARQVCGAPGGQWYGDDHFPWVHCNVQGALGVAVIPTAFLLGELVAIGILAGITCGRSARAETCGFQDGVGLAGGVGGDGERHQADQSCS
jgi:hypothetical protein